MFKGPPKDKLLRAPKISKSETVELEIDEVLKKNGVSQESLDRKADELVEEFQSRLEAEEEKHG